MQTLGYALGVVGLTIYGEEVGAVVQGFIQATGQWVIETALRLLADAFVVVERVPVPILLAAGAMEDPQAYLIAGVKCSKLVDSTSFTASDSEGNDAEFVAVTPASPFPLLWEAVYDNEPLTPDETLFVYKSQRKFELKTGETNLLDFAVEFYSSVMDTVDDTTTYEPDFSFMDSVTVDVKFSATLSWDGSDYSPPLGLAVAFKLAQRRPFKILIDRVDALQGSGNVSVPVVLTDGTEGWAGYDFLIHYDVSALSFITAKRGALLTDCEWEYFTFRHGPQGNCSGGCPDGLLRLVAIADLDNGDHHPTCDFEELGELAQLTFSVSSDRNLIGQCLPIGFYWLDCGDNALASPSGDTTYIALRVYNNDDQEITDFSPFPNATGPPDSCLFGAKRVPDRFVQFYNGHICILEPPDDRGDINLNGIANEVGDAVLFSNYFIHGDAVWDPPYQDGQILATDVNDDGVVLTVADLVYLIRIITGDEAPFPPGENPKLSPGQATAAIDWQAADGELLVNWDSRVDAGAVLLTFDHRGAEFGEPVLAKNASGMKMISHNNGAQLRVLIYGMERGAAIPAGAGTILRVPIVTSDPGLVLGEVEAADYWGNMMTVSAARPAHVPREFALFQNIPNPFNATTRIDFNLPDAGKVTLTVYNVLGQSVATLVNDHLEPGRHHIEWDARDNSGRELASGVYFYRIATTSSQASREMVLLK